MPDRMSPSRTKNLRSEVELLEARRLLSGGLHSGGMKHGGQDELIGPPAIVVSTLPPDSTDDQAGDKSDRPNGPAEIAPVLIALPDTPLLSPDGGGNSSNGDPTEVDTTPTDSTSSRWPMQPVRPTP